MEALRGLLRLGLCRGKLSALASDGRWQTCTCGYDGNDVMWRAGDERMCVEADVMEWINELKFYVTDNDSRPREQIWYILVLSSDFCVCCRLFTLNMMHLRPRLTPTSLHQISHIVTLNGEMRYISKVTSQVFQLDFPICLETKPVSVWGTWQDAAFRKRLQMPSGPFQSCLVWFSTFTAHPELGLHDGEYRLHNISFHISDSSGTMESLQCCSSFVLLVLLHVKQCSQYSFSNLAFLYWHHYI